MSTAAQEPRAITADGDARQVVIEWADGQQSVYSYDQLRWACPCATCRGEMGRPGALDFAEHLTPEQTELVGIAQVGRYAIVLEWYDGHNTGIFTYVYLRELANQQPTAS